MKLLLIFLLLSMVTLSHAQSDTLFNQTDAHNLKQGYWKKDYPNGKIMYRGFFKDNQPTGELRRYFESGALKAILIYDTKGEYAKARLFYEDGSLAATGVYYHSLKDSTWTYYSFYDKAVTTRENYAKGVRNGMAINYFNNGDVSEKLEWMNNKKSGIWEQYFKGTQPRLKAHYVNNKLDGGFLVYNENGKLYIAGTYTNDMRTGKWTFYNEDGTTEKQVVYNMGKAETDENLDAGQQEFFRTIDEAEGKFEEPDETNFLTPPNNH
jgi:antitoxin component YwqK of YwqJK toxin-antitoxin module